MKANKAKTLQDITAAAYTEKDLYPFCGSPDGNFSGTPLFPASPISAGVAGCRAAGLTVPRGPLSLADAAGTAEAGNLDHRMGDDECDRRGALGDRPLDRG